MRVLVIGSRDIEDKSVVYEALANAPWEPDVLVHGDAIGVDKIADRYARMHNIDRDVHEIPEWVWQKVGPRAGPMRNAYMIEQASAVVAVWDDESEGTLDAMQQAESEGLPIYKVVCDGRADEWGITRETLIEDDQMCLEYFAEASRSKSTDERSKSDFEYDRRGSSTSGPTDISDCGASSVV